MQSVTDIIKTRVRGYKHVPWWELENYKLNTLKQGTNRDIAALKQAILKRGFNFPFFVWADHNFLIDGAGRLMALRELAKEGHTIPDLPVIEIEADTFDEARAHVLHASSQHGQITQESFAAFVEDLDLSNMMDEINFPEITFEELDTSSFNEVDEDDVPEPPVEPVTQPGDVWQLGNHRLHCGDATSLNDVAALMGEDKSDCIFTDPPYNVDYSSKNEKLNANDNGNRNETPIKNDVMSDEGFYAFLFASFANMAHFANPGSAIYICHADSEGINFRTALINSGWLYHQCIIWVKNNMVLGHLDYHAKHELILYGWLPGTAHKWYGDRNKTTVWEIDKPQRSEEHPTMKPIELINTALQNSSLPGQIVLDLFGGSGSTLIACEQTGRICRTMEIEPRYCDVIVTRWENLTGQKAVKLGI